MSKSFVAGAVAASAGVIIVSALASVATLILWIAAE